MDRFVKNKTLCESLNAQIRAGKKTKTGLSVKFWNELNSPASAYLSAAIFFGYANK